MKKICILLSFVIILLFLSSCLNNNERPIEKHEHVYSSSIIKESTCDTHGIIRYTCDTCNYFYEEELPLLEHEHTFNSIYSYDENYHYFEATCHENVYKDKAEHIFSETILENSTFSKTGIVEYKCEVCGYTYTDILDKASLEIKYYNSGLDSKEICLFDNSVDEKNLNGFYKIFIKHIDDVYYCDNLTSSDTTDSTFDYVIATLNDEDNNNLSLLKEKDFHVGDYVKFNLDITNIIDETVSIGIEKDTTTKFINVEYDLGFINYQTKDDLYRSFFGDFYDFLITYTTCDMSTYDINSKEDFLVFCKTWVYNGRSEMGGLGDAFSKYYLTNDKTNSGITNQPTTTFLGYCYSQGKYLDLIEFFPVFFAYWRTDEGYTTSSNHGNEFYYSSWAAFVDTCKYFYFTSDSITDTYKWYTKQKSARVHYALDHVPNVSLLELVSSTEIGSSIELPDVYRMGYTFLGWYTEAVGGEKVESVSSSMTVYARFERTTHNINYYVDDNLYTTLKVSDGQCIKVSDIPSPYIEQYRFNEWLLVDGSKYDLLNAVYDDINFYASKTYIGDSSYATSANGFNTQRETTGFEDYGGIFIIKYGEKIDATKFWIKIAVKYIDGHYVVTDVKGSGEAMPTDYDYIIMSYQSETSGKYKELVAAGITVGMVVEFDKDLTNVSKGSCNINIIFKNYE